MELDEYSLLQRRSRPTLALPAGPELRQSRVAKRARGLLVASLGVVIAGCFAASGPPRPDPKALTGPPPTSKPVRPATRRRSLRTTPRAVMPPGGFGVGNATLARAIRSSRSPSRTASAGAATRPSFSKRWPASTSRADSAPAERRPARADGSPAGGLRRSAGDRTSLRRRRGRGRWAAACARPVTTTSTVSASAPCSARISASSCHADRDESFPRDGRPRANRCLTVPRAGRRRA